MSSPVGISFKNLIILNREESTPQYIQLAQQLINIIQRGYLPTGAKLPGTRVFAKELVLHRKTVVSAFDELQAQGWISIIPNKGTFVIEQDYNLIQSKPFTKANTINQYPKSSGFHFEKSTILETVDEENSCNYYLTDGTADIRLTQLKNLSQHFSASMNRKANVKRLNKYNAPGNYYFKEQLTNYLNYSRGLHIGKNNILVTRSTEMSLYIIARVLLKPEDVVVVAEWSNFAANMTFLQVGAKIHTIPMDDDGIRTDMLEQQLKKHKIRALYITPHHHYPTTVTLSAQRRLDLLSLANQHQFIIIEDDYDYDFHYEKSAVLPLASADTEGMVIYTGTFGKSLAPSFRTGFVVAPSDIIQEMNKYTGIIDKQGDIIMEQALGEMIEEGQIHRYLKKSLKIYQERRDNLCSLLEQELPDIVTCQKPSGGLALWMQFNKAISLLKLAKNCAKDDLYIPRTLLYQNKDITAMRVGFGHMNDDEMKYAIACIKKNLIDS